ncbi:hypothetical protein [Pseudoxanthomonas beigongshangi]
MPTRSVDGFFLTASTEPQEPGANFYEPAILVRKEDSDHVEVAHNYFAISQNVEERSYEQAYQQACEWLETIEYVRYYGNQWELG